MQPLLVPIRNQVTIVVVVLASICLESPLHHKKNLGTGTHQDNSAGTFAPCHVSIIAPLN